MAANFTSLLVLALGSMVLDSLLSQRCPITDVQLAMKDRNFNLSPDNTVLGLHTIFAQVVKGLDVLRRMNVLVVNKYDRPNKLTKLIRTLVVERPRHYEWRPYAESYGCFNLKGSHLAGKVEPGISVRKKKLERGSFKVVKRVSAAFVKPTHQGGWEVYRKRAF
ncbi:uncharacterized protein [Physcomitrium patens]|uniref:uncharacterized protein n=1 Tax=Physcomitrium patens TaxID=3218 RepID=UPI000D175257|nr:uncharacterized protein LOC112289399 [Physcomitrium patens]XP_024390339.1 uncharacterized protein LOC112289399 [Physcomitrium patens]XP_024390341.1 uncharacterized protein LOC112289399 [Physcomitrium patens]XP_024390342.1 uncharacterized protein LOC112289399 [Physcomitrium patens]XP_024390343.1 uncharacterized protein LOC112289399 [Physcomitrium patens]|eukprot:XP_024390338.1 uncharacterized protein LOC112289399 [Physcomitrella patens]